MQSLNNNISYLIFRMFSLSNLGVPSLLSPCVEYHPLARRHLLKKFTYNFGKSLSKNEYDGYQKIRLRWSFNENLEFKEILKICYGSDNKGCMMTLLEVLKQAFEEPVLNELYSLAYTPDPYTEVRHPKFTKFCLGLIVFTELCIRMMHRKFGFMKGLTLADYDGVGGPRFISLGSAASTTLLCVINCTNEIVDCGLKGDVLCIYPSWIDLVFSKEEADGLRTALIKFMRHTLKDEHVATNNMYRQLDYYIMEEVEDCIKRYDNYALAYEDEIINVDPVTAKTVDEIIR